MSIRRNIQATTIFGDGVTSKFNFNLKNKDYSYNLITKNFIHQEPLTNYTINDSNEVTFTIPPALGDTLTCYSFDTTVDKPITEKDNITNIIRTIHIGDGITKTFNLKGTNIKSDNYVVTVGGKVYENNNTLFKISNNVLEFLPGPLGTGIILQVFAFASNLYEKNILGGVSQRDNVASLVRTTLVADGVKDTYKITGASSNKSKYCLVFVNNFLIEGGIDYIISQNRVKFFSIPPKNAHLTFIAFKAEAIKKYTRVKYINKETTPNERELFNNYWREQISHYGVTVNYYTNLTTKANADYVYGESALAGYSEPEELNIVVKLDSENSMFTKFGHIMDSDGTAYIHHEDFQEVFGQRTEPKIGDLIELSEIGSDRLNYPDRGPRLMEIVDKQDEIPGETNNLAGHYVWYIKLKRFDYSREQSILPELGTKEAEDTGETISTPAGDINKIQELSKQIFDYDKNSCSNDDIYGDY